MDKNIHVANAALIVFPVYASSFPGNKAACLECFCCIEKVGRFHGGILFSCSVNCSFNLVFDLLANPKMTLEKFRLMLGYDLGCFSLDPFLQIDFEFLSNVGPFAGPIPISKRIDRHFQLFGDVSHRHG